MKNFLLIAFLLLFILPSSAFAEVPILIINQIRGNEACCLPGTVDMIQKIKDNEDLQTVPINWAVRYDALNDENYVSLLRQLPSHQSIGLLLEITPELTKKSGVQYKGSADGIDWHSARNAMLVGYTPDERRLLIDTAFQTFYDTFQHCPSFTVGWMTDAWSLTYISEKYGVKLHELTKEQYETDSYTLYGGVFNLPYIPIKNYPLLPAQNHTDGLDLVIVRQTVSDIDKNYGSYHAWYTSQPNDYLSQPDSKGIDYFKSLINQILNQSAENQFGLIGIENSQTEWGKYGSEYIEQLQYLHNLEQEKKIDFVSPIDVYENTIKNNDILRYLKTPDFPHSGKMWFFGDTFRVLLESIDGQVVISDYRVFTGTDPYADTPLKKNRAYWTVPYLIDSSQQFTEIEKNDVYAGDVVRADIHVFRPKIVLLENVEKFEETNVQLILSGKEGKVTIDKTSLTIDSNESPAWQIDTDTVWKLDDLAQEEQKYLEFPRHPRFVIERKNNIWNMGWENETKESIFLAQFEKSDDAWILKPNLTITQAQLNTLASLFYPDISPLNLDIKKSTFYWHNKEAIAGRSPIRLYINPVNKLGRMISIKDLKVTNTEDSKLINIKVPDDYSIFMDSFFVDFTASEAATGNIKIEMGDQTVAAITQISFYADCKKNVGECVRDLRQLFGYIKVWITDKWNEISKK